MGRPTMVRQVNKRIQEGMPVKQPIKPWSIAVAVVILPCSVATATPKASSMTLATTGATGVVPSEVPLRRGTITSAATTRTSAGTSSIKVGASRVVASRIDHLSVLGTYVLRMYSAT